MTPAVGSYHGGWHEALALVGIVVDGRETDDVPLRWKGRYHRMHGKVDIVLYEQ
jgi:hypothetical protein